MGGVGGRVERLDFTQGPALAKSTRLAALGLAQAGPRTAVYKAGGTRLRIGLLWGPL